MRLRDEAARRAEASPAHLWSHLPENPWYDMALRRPHARTVPFQVLTGNEAAPKRPPAHAPPREHAVRRRGW